MSRSRLLFCLTALLVACSDPSGVDKHPPELPPPAAVWANIAGGGTTDCSLGTPFNFWVRAGDSTRVAVILKGGGACWTGTNCDVLGQSSFDSRVDSTDNPTGKPGILDLTDTRNPLRDFTLVFVPYCTGDLQLGARTVTYTAPSTSRGGVRTYAIHHNGGANVDAVLDWIVKHVRDPRTVVVVGSSGGAPSTPLIAATLAGRYPRARVVQLGDAGGGYRAPEIPSVLASWGATTRLRSDPAYRSVDSASLNFPVLYTEAARVAPRVTFAQYDNAEDRTQLAFLAQLGLQNVSLAPLIAANRADIRRTVPALRSYTAPGSDHTILLRPTLYTLVVDGVPVRDWLAALVAGEPVQNVGEELVVPAR